LSAAWWRVVVGSALAFGACRWRLRASARSFSGAVVVAGFASQASAVRFGAAWGWWCGLSLCVRGFAGGVWAVSVPVSAPPYRSLSLPVPARLPAPVFVPRG
jgi:hypothetical protein